MCKQASNVESNADYGTGTHMKWKYLPDQNSAIDHCKFKSILKIIFWHRDSNLRP
jgi:hypothetical protein